MSGGPGRLGPEDLSLEGYEDEEPLDARPAALQEFVASPPALAAAAAAAPGGGGSSAAVFSASQRKLSCSAPKQTPAAAGEPRSFYGPRGGVSPLRAAKGGLEPSSSTDSLASTMSSSSQAHLAISYNEYMDAKGVTVYGDTLRRQRISAQRRMRSVDKIYAQAAEKEAGRDAPGAGFLGGIPLPFCAGDDASDDDDDDDDDVRSDDHPPGDARARARGATGGPENLGVGCFAPGDLGSFFAFGDDKRADGHSSLSSRSKNSDCVG